MKDLKAQFVGALLFILTVAAVCCAIINFRRQTLDRLPDDGVTWVDRKAPQDGNNVTALYVTPGSAASRAGLRAGDALSAIGSFPVAQANDVPQILSRIGAWVKAEYHVRRGGVEVSIPVVIGEAVPDNAVYYQYAVGAIYLAIGLFVYYRRVNAPRAVHFYILCFASFVLSSFHYTGKLNLFDKTIYWGNVMAGIWAPAIFLHFCLVYPQRRQWIASKLRIAAVYIPATILSGISILIALGILRVAAPLIEVRWFLDRIWLAYLVLCYLLGAFALSVQFRHVEDAVVARQLKYLRNGAILGIVPFASLYVLPYIFGAIPNHYQKMAVLSLVFIPITWAYAILRYRLMDVDIIFQQGYVYTLATLAVIGVFYGLIISFTHPDDLGPAMIVGLILFATFIFQPIRDWLQEQLDRHFFYKDRYDYRRTLLEFGRELSSETNLDAMLVAVADRLVHTLSIQHVGFFLARENDDIFELHTTLGHRKHAPPLPATPTCPFSRGIPRSPISFSRARAISSTWFRIAGLLLSAQQFPNWISPITLPAPCGDAPSPTWGSAARIRGTSFRARTWSC